MGAQRCKQKGGTFSEYLYRTVQTIEYKGLRIKVIEKYGDTQHHAQLPWSSGKADGYLRINGKTQQIDQLRIFKNRNAFVDFDWGHPHGGFPKGVVHIHYYGLNGVPTNRSKGKEVRLMNEQEITLYGTLLLQIDSKVKFK